jgi:hypothetical protein
LLPDATTLRLHACAVDDATAQITLHVRSTQTSVPCPRCAVPAHRIHSHYARPLADLPWAQYRVCLQLQVRKWCCRNRSCPRRIFTERLPTVAAPWARRTLRLAQRLGALGVALGGTAGRQLGYQWDLAVSRNTLLRLVALGQLLRHCANRIAKAVGEAHGERVRHGFEDKKAGWYAGLADPQMPAMRTGVEQAHNAIARKLFARKGCHHPGGSHGACLTSLAHLYHLSPSQRRALNAGQWGVAIEGGRVPTSAWVLNLPIRASGGYRPARRDATTSFGGVWVAPALPR